MGCKNASHASLAYFVIYCSIIYYTDYALWDRLYNTKIFGQYKVTIPAGKQQIVSVQLKASQMTVDGLFGSLSNRSGVSVQNIDPQSAQYGTFVNAVRRPTGAGWLSNAAAAVRLGQGVLVNNVGGSDTVLTFVGTVSTDAISFTGKPNFKIYWGATAPVAVSTPVTLGYKLAARDGFSRLNVATGSYTSYVVNPTGTAWLSGAPSFAVGEGFVYQAYSKDTTWVQQIKAIETGLVVSFK